MNAYVTNALNSLITSVRLIVATMLACVFAYTAAMLAFAQLVTPETAAGSLLTDQKGQVIGSRLIAQKFQRPGYFWPRPSAVDYRGEQAGGSNISPTSRDLAARARTNTIPLFGAGPGNPLPTDLATASGSGLDPHITERAALFQAERVARARGLTREALEAMVRDHAVAPGDFLTLDRLVNVLELNVTLDSLAGRR